VIPLSFGAAMAQIKGAGGNPWRRQRDIIRAVFDSPRRTTTVQSCTSSGKTHVAALIILGWMLTGRYRKVVTTAPTTRQVLSAIWSELRMIIDTAKGAGVDIGGAFPPRAAEWKLREGWIAYGFSSSREANYAGIHSKGGTLVIVDDAQGLDDRTFDTLQATLTGPNDRMLLLANPVERRGRFFEQCTKPELAGVTNRMAISAFDTPNIRLGANAIPGLVSREKVEDMRAFGEQSPLWRTRVLGEFPTEDDRALVPLAWLERSIIEWRALQPLTIGVEAEQIAIGADVARLGKDSGISAVVRDFLFRDPAGIPFRARIVDDLLLHPKSDTMETVAFLRRQYRDLKPNAFRVDADGLGAGIFDRLNELAVPVTGMRAGVRANDGDRFVNARSEWLIGIRNALRPHDSLGDDGERPHLCLPPSPALQHQLSTIRLYEESDGRLRVEPKKEWKQRNEGRSPDEMDALAMALADEPLHGETGIGAVIAAYG